MIKKKKLLIPEVIPEFEASVANMPDDSKIFVDKSLEIASYISQVLIDKNLKQKDLAFKLGKTEAEISKWLTGMHNFTLRSISKLEAALDATIICTPRHSRRTVPVTETFKLASINAFVNKKPGTTPAKLVPMHWEVVNDEQVKEAV